MREEFYRIKRLPPYIFAVLNERKLKARRAGRDVVDLAMGNPDLEPPAHVIAKLKEAVDNPRNHRYSASMGIKGLRKAIANWYQRRYSVDIDYKTEAIATMGSKEGLAHLLLAIIGPGDVVLVPNPTYPIHQYGVVIAGGDTCSIPLKPGIDFMAAVESSYNATWPRPMAIILSFPHNPTTAVADLSFFEEVIDFARKNNIIVIHDLAYADLCFDGYRAPSIMQIKGAKECAVEFTSLSKSFSMAGWRVGFGVGNERVISALARVKSYLDYGMFQPIQIAATHALNGPEDCTDEIRETYCSRRNVLCDGLNRMGWEVPKPQATMFVWAPVPPKFKKDNSLDFALRLLEEGNVVVSPGIGFGHFGEGFVRFALVENEHRIRQAIRGIRRVFT